MWARLNTVPRGLWGRIRTGREWGTVRAKIKRASLRQGRERRVDKAGLCKVHGTGPRFGLTRVCGLNVQADVFFPFFLSSPPPSFAFTASFFALPSTPSLVHQLALLVPSFRSPSLTRPLNAILGSRSDFRRGATVSRFVRGSFFFEISLVSTLDWSTGFPDKCDWNL